MSDGITLKPGDLQIWRNWKRNGRKDKRAAHRHLQGLCRSYCNDCTDFFISNNLWPVKFEKDGHTTDMSLQYAICFWGAYVNKMKTRPDYTSKAAQKVFKYVLQNIPAVVKTWRSRLYFFSSATIFRCVRRLRIAYVVSYLINSHTQVNNGRS